ncbi:helix-turn-helix transcriptional regulator [Ensifer sp. Root127]|uniref:helix-turn-helix transcriptional regulator n=1 Tax=Ensifer sp. Root127 TaxID=1736440 RepID=UPI00070FFA4E|nr:helix-turn-helix transcriptional regulator [Ensifer sp. Root127]KQW54793.1 hypothetical protein ASD03_19695 [Ensifer sp. Root127]
MVLDVVQLEKAAASLSEVVTDPAGWPQILDDISRAVRAEGAAVLSNNPGAGFLVSPNLEEAFHLYFEQSWYKLDIRRRGIPKLMRGTVLADDDVATNNEIATDPYYNEFLPSVGLRWWSGLGFRVGGDLCCLAIQRTERQGRFSLKEKRILQTLLPRLNEIGALAHAVGRNKLVGITNTLDRMELAAVAVDRAGHVVCSNASADRLFGESMRIRGGRLVIRDAEAAANYESLLLRCKLLPEGRSLGADLVVIRRGEQRPVVLRALPIDGAARYPLAGACALFILTEVGPAREPELELMVKVFGLTPAESRLAARISTGESLDDAADQLGVCKETARNQLKAIFGKTDTHRQSELVALLAGLSAGKIK